MAELATPVAPEPSSIYRRILVGSGIYSVAIVAQRMASLVMLPLFTRFLTPSEYGALEIMDLTLNIFGMLFGGNFCTAIFYHYFEAQTQEARNRVVSTTVFGAAMLGFTAAAVGWILAAPLSRLVFQTPIYAHFLRIMFVNFAFTLPLEACFYWLRALDRPVLFVSLSLCRLFLAVSLNVVFLVGLGMGLSGVVYGTALTAGSLSIGMGAYCISRTGIAMQFRLFRRLLRYTVPVSLAGIAMFAMHYFDRFILQRFTTLADIGIYSLAYKIGMMVSYLHSSFQTYWTSQMYEVVRGKQGARVYASVFTYLVLFLSAVGLGLLVSAGPALRVFAGPAFQSAAFLVPWLVLAYVLRAAGDYFRSMFYIENTPATDARLNWLGAAVCVGADFALIPYFSVWGATAATVLTFIVVSSTAFRWASRLRSFELENARLGKIATAASAVVVLHYLIPSGILAAQIGLGLALLLLFPLMLAALGFFNDAEWAWLGKLQTGVFRRVKIV